MIYFSIFATLALFLNICGRILILRRDQQASDAWRKALAICPGADAVYVLLRWQNARLGCALCALSLVLAAPVAHHLLTGQKPESFSLAKVLQEMTQEKPAASAKADVAALQKLAQVKEKQLLELNKYLQKWFETLTARQSWLRTEDSAEIAEYNRVAAAYQNLMQVWKSENESLNQIRSRIAVGG